MRATGDKTIRLSAINITTEGRALAWDFSFTLFWRLMTGYRIPISLSCPCSRLEDCVVEHLEAACWMGSIIAGPPALQRAHSGHGLSATARRGGRAGGGGREEEKEDCSWEFYPCRDLLFLTSLQVEIVGFVPSSIMHNIAALIQSSSPWGGLFSSQLG